MPTRMFVFALLLLPTVGLSDNNIGAARAEVTALSVHGTHRIRLESISQGKSPWNPQIYALTLRFRMEFPQNGSAQFLTVRPANVYIENEDPLVAAYITPNLNIASNKHFGWTDNFGLTVEVHDLEVGEARRQLHRIELAVTLVKVTEWEEREFKNLKMGPNDYLKCGPFEILGTGERTRFLVSAGSWSKFEAEHKTYRQRVPLEFLNHRYAMDHISIVDSRGRPLSVSVVFGSGGSSSGDFVIPRGVGSGFTAGEKTTYPSGIFGSADTGEEIKYPLSIKVRLPTRYEKERVNFQIENIQVPAPNLEPTGQQAAPANGAPRRR